MEDKKWCDSLQNCTKQIMDLTCNLIDLTTKKRIVVLDENSDDLITYYQIFKPLNLEENTVIFCNTKKMAVAELEKNHLAGIICSSESRGFIQDMKFRLKINCPILTISKSTKDPKDAITDFTCRVFGASNDT